MTINKLKLDQIPFGTLNNISDAGGPSTDRRRTNPLEFLRLSTEEAYSRDALANKDSFEGIVIAKRTITYPSVKNKSALLKDYVIKSAQKSDNKEVEQTADYPTFVYKVYIPEIEPRPVPRGTGDPIIATYADVYSDVTPSANGIDIGSIVRVIYEDVGTLYGPKISAIVSPPVLLAGYEKQQRLDHAFKTNGTPLPVGAAVPERKLLAKEIKQYSMARPDFTGPTPNADRFRKGLEELGYKEKVDPPGAVGELSNGGDIKSITADMGLEVLKEIKKQAPNVKITMTAGNDKYHQVIKDAKMYVSRHTWGGAFDFVFYPVEEKYKKIILEILQGFSAANTPFRFLDEYKSLTAAGSGKHFHFSYGLGSEQQEEQKKFAKLLAEGKIKGYKFTFNT
tara:strand:- start:303 stop:1487 length:1185 start_codon:yes stop_codon:yes gene_type:complete